MVKASELRLGNLLYKQEDEDDDKAIVIVDKYTFEYDVWDWFSGIPLTPEILQEWCGFKPLGDDTFLFDLDSERWLVYGQEDGNYYFGISQKKRVANNYLYNAEKLYLHQLQNLYFALTQTELPVNIPQTV